MATYRTDAGLTYADFDEPDWHEFANANVQKEAELLGPLAVDFAEHPSASLNVKVAAGAFRKADGGLVSYAGTVSWAVTASATRYLWLDDAGTLTEGAAWPAADHVRLAVIVTGASTVTSITDARVPWQSFGTTTFLATSGGTLADGADLVLGTTTGTRIGTAADQKLGLFGAAPVVQPAGASQGALTDNTGGTVDGTLEALPDPADAPASVDALRDDLALNLLPALRNDLADLADRVNALRSALVALGAIKGSA